MAEAAEAVREDGFAGPLPLLTAAECALLVDHLRYRPPATLAWHKGLAVTDRLLFDLATRARLMELVGELLGEDVVLWGASVVARRPGDRHVWHCDIETAAADKHSASVWVGLENTTRESALLLMSRSHRFGRSVQQAVAEAGIERGAADDDTVLRLARELDPEAGIVPPDVRDGEALVFDGRLWHGSDHRAGDGRRLALLLQYAAAGTEIGIPDPDRLDWPFGFRPGQPPSILVSGRANGTPNWLVPPPPGDVGQSLDLRVEAFALPLAEDPATSIARHHGFEGSTPNAAEMESHISVISPGFCPHSLQAHLHEELWVILDGEAETWVADGPFPAGVDAERRVPGDVVYHPAYQHHTVRAAGDGPLTYAVFKWWGEPAESEAPAKAMMVRSADQDPPGGEPFAMKLLFEQPTAFLGELHSHLTVLQPGAGYDAHTDEHDVAIVLLSGHIEVNGRQAGPRGVVYVPAGRPHDMRNAGTEPARYVVFEFHASRPRPEPEPPAPGESERDRLARELDTVLTSSSWRLTAPLRRLAAAVRARRD